MAPNELDPATLTGLLSANGAPDVVIDLVGGAYVTADVLAAALFGRIVIVGTLAGGEATLPLLPLMRKRLRLLGTMLRIRSAEEKAAMTAAFMPEMGRHLASGRITPVVDRVLPLDEAPAAYELLASDTTFGKVVL